MNTDVAPRTATNVGWRAVFAPRRLAFSAVVALLFAIARFDGTAASATWALRAFVVALAMTTVFGLVEQFPPTLPGWLPRWPLQVGAVLLIAPFACLFAYLNTAGVDYATMISTPSLKSAFYTLLGPSVLLGPWLAFAAIVRRRDALAREQAWQFEVQRAHLEKEASEARLRLMQTQVQPHFLFNTLANVRALVRARSPNAADVLDSLIAYLRAAIPRTTDEAATVADELSLVRAYLQLMQLRMPDRLVYSVDAEPATLALICPPLTLVTLVENAVRHGIDPSETGGRIDVRVTRRQGDCIATVTDSGVGLRSSAGGSGLQTLRARLRLAFGDAQVTLSQASTGGAMAEVRFPAREFAGEH